MQCGRCHLPNVGGVVVVSGSKVIDLVHELVSMEDVGRSVIYWDTRVVRAGVMVDLGGQRQKMPYDGTLAIIDLAPSFNWAHPCLLLMIRDDGGEVRTVRASFPPRGRGFPDAFQIILRFGKAS
jgi:hypothetical protein